MPAVEC